MSSPRGLGSPGEHAERPLPRPLLGPKPSPASPPLPPPPSWTKLPPGQDGHRERAGLRTTVHEGRFIHKHSTRAWSKDSFFAPARLSALVPEAPQLRASLLPIKKEKIGEGEEKAFQRLTSCSGAASGLGAVGRGTQGQRAGLAWNGRLRPLPPPSDWAMPCCGGFEPLTDTSADGDQARDADRHLPLWQDRLF